MPPIEKKRTPMAFTIRVNGDTRTADVDGDTPLLWVTRDLLGKAAVGPAKIAVCNRS